MLNNGQTVLRADQIAKMTDRLGAAPKVAEFPVAGERGGVPDDVIVNVLFVDVRADDIGMIVLEKTLCKFAAKSTGFLRRSFADLMIHTILNEAPQRLQQRKQPCGKHWDIKRTDEEHNHQQNIIKENLFSMESQKALFSFN